MKRKELAERIASGVAGWLQQLAAQELETQVGEDAARVEIVRMISAQKQFVPETSSRPPNWPQSTKKRVDIGVLGKSAGTSGWYAAIELKWPTESVDVAQLRHRVVEDVARVAFSKTTNLGGNFLLIGGTRAALNKLFATPHPHSEDKEKQRKRFCKLLSRKLDKPDGKLTGSELDAAFPDYGDRVPQTVFNGFTRPLKTALLACSRASVGQDVRGSVYVWQCSRR